ncbi:hypothetical protein ANO11243_020020 [Dothideomycetidae sp. 11243]|nr:hypothetical protein ANO11243_020020 [fungal sp. No.11243]
MAFEALARLGAKADRLMMFPDDWTVDNNTSEGKLLVKARDDYGVKLVPVRVESFPGEPTWAESFTKLFAFNQTAYKRVLSLDSDSTILQPMDELFFLPSAPVAMPRAYWLESPGILSSQLVLLEPSTIEFDRVLEALGSRKPTDFDMEIVNDLYGKDCIIIPHRKYDLITGEFRYKDHATYLGSNREHWDARKAYEEAKFVHFSDWPLPKPWHLTAASDIARTQPVAAELLNSLPDDLVGVPDGDLIVEDDFDSIQTLDAYEARLQRRERRKFLAAKSFFDCKEFDRCAVTLLPSLLPQQPVSREIPVAPISATPTKAKARAVSSSFSSRDSKVDVPELSQRSLFLSLYARFLAGEKRKEEDSEMILGPSDGPVTANKELVALSGILEDYFSAREASKAIKRQSDGFLEYLYGVILAKGRNDDLARHWLLRSVKLYEWNWSAWQELAALTNSVEMLAEVCQQLTPSVPAFLFQVFCSQELYQSTDALHDTITQLNRFFPSSAFLSTQRALLFYHAKEYDSAAAIFSDILASHPYRLDSMDVYSNILYVMDSARPKLSYLASLASATDRFRPETCCIIGNHYSKSSEHEKAVVYFRRALTLDRHFLSAWTLMGHEYIELKNTQAAIESYRRAVDSNAKDYRAWHGLGLGYELLDMHSYALYYYNRAAALQPWDPKMWTAVGSALDKCGKPAAAIRAYKRALAAPADAAPPTAPPGLSATGVPQNDPDPLAHAVGGRLDPDLLLQIALLFEALEDIDEAAAYMELCLAQEEGPDDEDTIGGPGVVTGVGVTQTTSRARLWLAKWALARCDYDRCIDLANELCQDGFEVEEAKSIIKDARGRKGDTK